MKRLIALLLVLASAGATAHALAQQIDDPLACLPDRGDGAMTWRIDSAGRWRYMGAGDVPALAGVHGEWNGYSDTAGWSYSFGWPDDMEAVQTTVLYRTDRKVGYLWFYESPSQSDLRVLFVFTSMQRNADSSGRHDGEHSFCWWGSLVE
jgi:hypothetical protein